MYGMREKKAFEDLKETVKMYTNKFIEIENSETGITEKEICNKIQKKVIEVNKWINCAQTLIDMPHDHERHELFMDIMRNIKRLGKEVSIEADNLFIILKASEIAKRYFKK